LPARPASPPPRAGRPPPSLVAHCLGITTPDPLALDLYFERFLNPARATPPDIDTDICSRRRDELIHHVFETYGARPEVAMVAPSTPSARARP
jgi:DNA polymerase III subunit alpha